MISLFIITFLFCFGWRYNSVIDITAVISVILIYWVFFVRSAKIHSIWLKWIALLAVTIFYALVIVTLHGSYDLFPAARLIRAIIILLGGMSLCQIFIDKFKDRAIYKVISTLYWCVFAHGLIMITMYLEPNFRLFIISLTGSAEFVNDPIAIELGLRVTGLTYGLGTTSVLQAFSLFLLLPMIKNSTSIKQSIMLIISSIVPVLSIGLAGRSGLVLGSTFLIFFIILSFPHARVKTVAVLCAAGLIIIGLATAAVFLFFDAASTNIANITFTLGHLQEILILLEEGESNTTRFLSNMIFLPDNFFGLLFGEGNSGRGVGKYIPSDIGFILGVFSLGIVGSILYLVSFLYPALTYLKRLSLEDTHAIAIMMIFFIVVLMHMKEVSIFTRQLWSFQALLGSLLLLRVERSHSSPSRELEFAKL